MFDRKAGFRPASNENVICRKEFHMLKKLPAAFLLFAAFSFNAIAMNAEQLMIAPENAHALLLFEEEGKEPVPFLNYQSTKSPDSQGTIIKGTLGDALDITLSETVEAREAQHIIRGRIRFTARRPVSFILTRALHFTPRDKPVFLCPGYIYNTNNAEKSQGKFPQLDYKGPVGTPESSIFSFRSDRSSHCSVMAMFDERIIAMAIREGTLVSGVFHYNGLAIDTSSASHDALAVTIGFKNYPARYNGNTSPRISPRWNEAPDYGWIRMDRGDTAETEFLVYLGHASDNFAYEAPLRVFYDFLKGDTRKSGDPMAIAGLIADAIVADTVAPECGLFRVTDNSAECDIGWTGGMMVAGPLLAWGKRSGNADSVNAALRAVDSLTSAGFNMKASLFFDSCRKGVWTVDGWWRNWAGGHHLAYTNGQAVYFILNMWETLSEEEKRERGIWLERCRAVMNTALKHQMQNGEFPASYSPEDASSGAIEGFGGCWFVPAALKAYQVFEDKRYLIAAIRAEKFYFDWLRTLEVWGTPIDAEGAVELEGNLALVKAERLLHESTKEPIYRDHLERAVNYDISWKWAYNTHFENPPLRDMNWLSQGGNGASSCNIHLHPMSNMILDDLWYLYNLTGDDYYRRRFEDSLDFGMGCINLEDNYFGFGKAGWGTEQFFHTDALQGQEPRDGGIWTRYLCWATAAVLHSLVTAPEAYMPGK